MKVDFTDAATQDLAEIGRYIVEQNPSRAVSYLEELRRACLEIAEMPEAFVKLSSLPLRRLRKRIFGRYLIFYTTENQRVTILRIMSGSRDYERILEKGLKE